MAKKMTRADTPTRARKSVKRHEPPSIAEMAFKVTKRGNQYFVEAKGAMVAGPYKTRAIAQKQADAMEQRAPR